MYRNTMIIGVLVSVMMVVTAGAVLVSDSDVDAVDDTQVVYTTDGETGSLTFYMDTTGFDQLVMVRITTDTGTPLRGNVVGNTVTTSADRIADLDGSVSYLIFPLGGGYDNYYAQGTFIVGTVTFEGDGATGTMDPVRVGGSYVLPENGFDVPAGKEFGGWMVNGVGTPVAAGDTIEITGDMTVTAVWNVSGEPVPENPVVSFEQPANGSLTVTYDGKEIQSGDEVPDGAEIVITADADEDYELESLTVNGVDFENGGTYTVDVDVTIAAVFKEATVEPDEVTVTFDSNGGTGTMEPQTITVGEATVLNANVFTRDGYTFTGWNTQADGKGDSYEDGAEVTLTSDLELYAQWTLDQEPEMYTVTIDDVEHMTITVKAGDEVITSGTEVEDGTVLTVTYEVEKGYKLVSSSGTTVTVEGGDVSITATVDPILVTGIQIDKPTLSLKVGGTGTISATVTPAEALDATVIWSSSDENVVTVDEDGNISAVGIGNATITVSANDGSGVTATCQVTVTSADVPSFTVGVGNVTGGGSVTVSQVSVPEGGIVSYIVSPAYGWIVKSVTVGGEIQEVTDPTGFTGRYTVSSDVTIDVEFVSDAIGTVTVTAGDHGSIGAGGASSATLTVYGHYPTSVVVKADSGYRVASFEADGEGVSFDGKQITIAAGSKVTTITVGFEQTPVIDDDDEEYVPPVVVVRPDDGGDSTTYIVAIAAAAVVAVLAAIILMQSRKS